MFKVFLFLKDGTYELWTFDDMESAYHFAKAIYDDSVQYPDDTNIADVQFNFSVVRD